MAYRGENIDFVIKGDSKINLDQINFKVLIYPDRHEEEAIVINKAIMTRVAASHYKGQIGYSETKDLPLGMYTIEVLLIEKDTERSIFMKRGAFPLYDSASRNIE